MKKQGTDVSPQAKKRLTTSAIVDNEALDLFRRRKKPHYGKKLILPASEAGHRAARHGTPAVHRVIQHPAKENAG
jgi:hypothetical protein